MRDKIIWEAYFSPPEFDEDGKVVKVTLASLGREHNITPERVRQIINAESRRRSNELKETWNNT